MQFKKTLTVGLKSHEYLCRKYFIVTLHSQNKSMIQ